VSGSIQVYSIDISGLKKNQNNQRIVIFRPKTKSEHVTRTYSVSRKERSY
jgi:hypothetical protein